MNIIKNLVILVSSTPIPRTLKRIDTLKRKYNVSIIYWDRQAYEEKKDYNRENVYFLPIRLKAPMGNLIKRLLPYFKFKKIALQHLQYIKPTYLHIQDLDMLLIAKKYKKKYPNTIIVYEIADLGKYIFYEDKPLLKKAVYKFLNHKEEIAMKSISGLVLTSPYYWDRHYSDLFNYDKTLVIPNVPKKQLFEYFTKKKSNPFTIGFIGSVRYFDNIVRLISAVQELDVDINVLIAGSGPDLNELKNYIYRNNINFVTLYGPYNYEKEIVELYESIDVVFSVYNSNTQNVKYALPNRLYEAINCELPIIVAKGTKLCEIVTQYQIGKCVASESIDELKNAIYQLYLDKKVYYDLSKNAANIKINFQYEYYETKLLDFYNVL